MKKLIIILNLFFITSVFAQDDCYMLKDVMKDNKESKSKICRYGEFNVCFFTEDRGRHTYTFQVSCDQFTALERYLEQHPEIHARAVDLKETP